MSMSIIVRPVRSTELEARLGALGELLRDAVNDGASLGFLPEMTVDEARSYWRSLLPELQTGVRVLLAAFARGRIVGTAQLRLPSAPNAFHRAEVQKVVVAAAVRGQGVGRLLMEALHHAARAHGRSLLLLNTRHRGPAERFYRALGYREVGVIPGYAAGAAGERYDDVSLYVDLSAAPQKWSGIHDAG